MPWMGHAKLHIRIIIYNNNNTNNKNNNDNNNKEYTLKKKKNIHLTNILQIKKYYEYNMCDIM